MTDNRGLGGGRNRIPVLGSGLLFLFAVPGPLSWSSRQSRVGEPRESGGDVVADVGEEGVSPRFYAKRQGGWRDSFPPGSVRGGGVGLCTGSGAPKGPTDRVLKSRGGGRRDPWRLVGVPRHAFIATPRSVEDGSQDRDGGGLERQVGGGPGGSPTSRGTSPSVYRLRVGYPSR